MSLHCPNPSKDLRVGGHTFIRPKIVKPNIPLVKFWIVSGGIFPSFKTVSDVVPTWIPTWTSYNTMCLIRSVFPVYGSLRSLYSKDLSSLSVCLSTYHPRSPTPSSLTPRAQLNRVKGKPYSFSGPLPTTFYGRVVTFTGVRWLDPWLFTDSTSYNHTYEMMLLC